MSADDTTNPSLVPHLEIPHVDEAMEGALGHDGPLADHGQAVNDGVLSLVLVTLGQQKVHHDGSVLASCKTDFRKIRKSPIETRLG